MVTAISQGSRVEDLSARTPSSASYANPDGTWTLESFSGLVRAKEDDDKWVGVDPTLADSKDGVTPAAVPFDVEYGDGGSKDLATVTSPSGSTLSVDWPAKLPAGAVDGQKVTYEPSSIADAANGDGDLVVTSFPEGFNFSVVLDRAPAVDQATDSSGNGTGGAALGPEYQFPLSLSQGRFVERADGSIDIKSGGKLVATITPPVMWDSADEPKTVPVEAALEGGDTDTNRVLVLRPDPDYLADPERVYPVTVDPTVVLAASGDTWVQSGLTSTSQYTSPELRVGTSNLGINQAKSYLNFDTSSLGNPQPGWIVDAKVSLSNFDAGSCSGSAIRLSQITSSWTVPGITWNSQPTVTTTGSTTNDTAYGFTGCTTEGVVDFDAKEIVKSWAGGTTNYGVQLAAVSGGANASMRKYRSLENGDNAKAPKLTVTISQPPATPSSLTATPGLYNNFVTSKTPKLSAVVTDPDGGQVKGYFEVKQGSTLVWSGTSTAVASGGTATIEVPAGNLTEGTAYTISAWGEDDVNVRSTTPATKTVTVDTIAPTVTVTSSHFTNGTWATTVPGSATTSLDGSADTGGFNVKFDGVTATLGANTSGDKTMTYTPTAGWHVFEVTPIDRAGNYGTPVTFAYGTGAAAFTTPTQWTPSTASFPIDLSGPASATGATLQWRLTGETTWRTATKINKTDGTNWTGTVTGTGRSTTGTLVWNATEEDYGTGKLKGTALLETRGCFQYSGSADSCTTNLYLSLYASAFSDRFPTTELGPAQVALLNGEAMISDTDAADSKAGIGRTFSSLADATLTEGLFGPAWSDPQILAPSSDSAATVIDNRSKDGTLVIVDADGGSQTFTPTGGGNYKPLQPTGDATKLTLTTGTPDTLALSRPLGTGAVVTTWEWKTSDTGDDPAWTLKATDAPGATNDIAVTSTSQRPTFIRQSDPAASSTCNATTQTEGCRALKITYTGTGNSTRVSKIERLIGATTPSAVALKTLADYTYTSGKLTKVCGPDPDGAGTGTPLCTEYTYNTVASRTMLATLKPAGLTEWRFGYDSIGRLENVKRERPTANGGGDATWSIDYSLTPTSNGLPEMSGSKTAEWGQVVAPTKVYAVYQPYTGAADVTKAELVYTTSGGTTTNTATYGPTGWLIDTTWHDARGNIIQQLNTAGWARAQAASIADRPRIAAEASSYTLYNTWGSADTVGTRVVDEYGPARQSVLNDGTIGLYRTHTSYVYDDDPNVDAALIADRPTGTAPGIVVKRTASTASVDRTTDYDETLTKYGYSPNVAGDGNGWTLGTPTSVSTKVDASTWSTEFTRYNASGKVVETRQPGGSTDGTGVGNDARSTNITYYTGTGSGDCGGQPAWDGLVCKEGPSAQPAGTEMPTTHYAAYNGDLNPIEVRQLVAGTARRTTSTTFDNLGRSTSTTVTTGGSDVSADTLTTTTGYSATSGLQTTTSADGVTITVGYDSWGRQDSYADGTGNTASTSFDGAGRISAENTGVVTTNFSYDDHGFMTSATTNSGVGTFQYAYRPDGMMESVDFPNGLVARFAANEAGVQTGISYDLGGTNVLAFTKVNDVAGRAVHQTSPASAQSFAYDHLGRLERVQDTRGGSCTTRIYGFSTASERTSLTSYGAGAAGACQTSTPHTSKTSTYDSANRITNTGYQYDALGRTLAVPATDTAPGGSGALAATYRANDMVSSLSQDLSVNGGIETRLASYGLDPAGRIATIANKSNGNETNRIRYQYDSSSDTPAAVQTSTNGGSTWSTTKAVRIPGLGLAAQATTSGIEYSVLNPHGDIVATTNSSGTMGQYSETDEYGVSQTPTTRYAWLGSHQRSTDSIGGIILMGARLYNPSTGQFLSVDPVPGGTATKYAYPTNPVTNIDVTGMFEVSSEQFWRSGYAFGKDGSILRKLASWYDYYGWMMVLAIRQGFAGADAQGDQVWKGILFNLYQEIYIQRGWHNGVWMQREKFKTWEVSLPIGYYRTDPHMRWYWGRHFHWRYPVWIKRYKSTHYTRPGRV